MCKWFLALAVFLPVVLLFGGCGGGTLTYPYAPISTSVAPKATDNLYFAKPIDGFGPYVGLPGFPLYRGDAKWLGSTAGFEFYQSHEGGIGDTLEILSAENGVYLDWAYNYLMDIACFKNWHGEVELEHHVLTGIRIGSTAADFKSRFPNFIEGRGVYGYLGGSSYRTVFIDEDTGFNYNLTADCDVDGIIQRLRVDGSDSNDFNYFGPFGTGVP